MQRIELQTQPIINVIRLIAAIPLILVVSIIFKIFSFYGLEFLLMGFLLSVLLWNFKIKYSAKGEFKEHVFYLTVKHNMFGHKNIVLKSKILDESEKYKTKEDTFDLQNEKLSLKLKLLGLNSKKPYFVMSKLKP